LTAVVKERGAAEFIDYLPDFKQTRDRMPVPGMNPDMEHENVRRFISRNGDMGLLGGYSIRAGEIKRTRPPHLARGLLVAVGVLALLAVLAPVRGDSDSDSDASIFGEKAQSGAALMGVLYDLKQTQDHQPTGMDPEKYNFVLDDYLSNGWNESVLDAYYQVSQPLYTTQIFVPNMSANAAPRAFGAEQTVKPRLWVIHYKGQVSAPETGTYRFWGAADDALDVAVNGQTVLVGNRPDTRTPHMSALWKSTARKGAQAADDPLTAGSWMNLQAGEIIDLDVIIGERPGGQFNAFLMIEKQGATYPLDRTGHPILPIFQVAPYDTPKLDNTRSEPLFSTGYPIWKSYQ
jgi:hypothetical protein